MQVNKNASMLHVVCCMNALVKPQPSKSFRCAEPYRACHPLGANKINCVL